MIVRMISCVILYELNDVDAQYAEVKVDNSFGTIFCGNFWLLLTIATHSGQTGCLHPFLNLSKDCLI